MGFVGKTITGIIAMFFSSLIHGWGLSVLWGWFIVPLFNAPILTIAPAVGLGMTVRYITGYSDDDDTKHDTYFSQIMYIVFKHILVSLMSVFLGWIVLQFI